MKKNSYILGINDGHLATAALAKDGEVIACVSEERFTGIKNQPGIPDQSIKYCLDYANISADDVDLVVFGGIMLPPTEKNQIDKSLFYDSLKPVLTAMRLSSVSLPIFRSIEEAVYPVFFDVLSPGIQNKRIQKLQQQYDFENEKITFVDHHLCHAYSALFTSGFADLNKPLLIFTCDGEGDKLSATVNVFKDGKFKTISRTSMTNSLGNLYRSVTKYLGMKPLEHEYKVMGLAAYVEDRKADDLYRKMKDLIVVDNKTLQIKSAVNSQLFKLGYLDRFFKEYRFDYIASATQRITEEVLSNWISTAIRKTKIENILLSGGVFMNVKANQRIAEIDNVKTLFIMPSCGDESNAIGAAYWGHRSLTGQNPRPPKSLYLGPDFGDTEIKREIKGKKYKITVPKDMEKKIAQILALGGIVARFSGRSEWGARALGNRSILTDASRLDAISVINKMIKSRDFWMPFAPAIMEPYSKKYIINPKDIKAPYMIITFDTTEKGRQDLAAGMHQYDKTVRPQIINKETNYKYYKILEEFSKITGRHGILNTSFNLHGSPIVGTPADALNTFENSGLKYLALGKYLIQKTK